MDRCCVGLLRHFAHLWVAVGPISYVLSRWPGGVQAACVFFTAAFCLPAAALGGQRAELTLFRQGDWKGTGDFCSAEMKPERPCLIARDDLKKLQTAVLDGYTVPADVTRRDERLTPKGWVDAQSDPRQALSVGFPRPVQREEQTFVIPVFALPVLQFFQGDSEVIGDLNAAIRYWQNAEEKRAYEMLTGLVRRVADFAPVDQERALVYLVRGFLSLDRAVRVHAGQISTEESAAFWRVRARGDFFKGMGEPDLALFVSAVDQTLDRDLYLDTLKNAQFLEDGLGTPVRPPPVKSGATSASPLSWMRSVAPAVLFNLITLSRVQGQFGKAFTAAEKLESLSVRMPGAYDELTAQVLTVFTGERQPNLSKPVFLRPGHLNDLIALSYLVRAAASVRAKDPIRTLRYADETIRHSQSRSLAALGFTVFGNVYYDLRNLEWARRSYAWAEMMDPGLLDVFPYSLFWGAEAAFWLGDVSTARQAFVSLRGKLSDRAFGPLVELRLLQLDLLDGVRKPSLSGASAAERMTYLRTHYTFAPVHQDVLVLDFCWNARDYSVRLLAREHEQLVRALSDAPLALKEQAEACRLFAALELMRLEPGAQSGTGVDAAARRQLAQIGAFRKEFPDSPYLQLIEKNVSLLELSPVLAHLDQNNCQAVIDFYQANEEALWKTAPPSAVLPVKGLRWTPQMMAQTIRCAAYLALDPLWKNLRKRAGGDQPRLQEQILALRELVKGTSVSPVRLSAQVLQLRDLLLKDAGWPLFVRGVRQVDLATSALVGDDSFWSVLGLSDLVSVEPLLQASDSFYDGPLIFGSENHDLPRDSLVCTWAFKGLDSRKTPLAVFQRRSLVPFGAASDWLNLVSDKGKVPPDPVQCRTWLLRKALKEVTLAPFPAGDDQVLWPFLNHVGVQVEPELALDLARRTFDREPSEPDRVVEVFQDIADNIKEDVYRTAAQRWLKEYYGGARRSFW